MRWSSRAAPWARSVITSPASRRRATASISGHRIVAAEPGGTLVDTRAPGGRSDLAIVATGADFDHLPGTTAVGRPPAAGPAPDARDRAVRRRAHHQPRRRPHPALLPGLRRGAAGRARPAGPGRGRAPHAAAPGAADRRRPHRRRHPRLRRAVRLRAERGSHGGAAGPCSPHPRRAAPAGATAVGGRVRPAARRRGVPARGDRGRRRPGHRSRRSWHDLRAGHCRRHPAGGGGVPA